MSLDPTMDSSRPATAGGGMPSGFHLVAALDRLGLGGGRGRTRLRPPPEITETDLPAAAVLHDGTALLIHARDSEGVFDVEGPAGRRRLDLAGLAALATGTLIGAEEAGSPAAEPVASPSEAAGAAGPAARKDVAEAEEAELAELASEVADRGLVPVILRRTTFSGLGWQLGLAALIGNLMGFALPIYSMAVYDRVIPHGAIETLAALTIGIGLVFGIDLVMRIVRNRLQEAIGLATNFRLQAFLYRQVTGAELGAVRPSQGSVNSAMQTIEALCLSAPAIIAGLAVDLPFVALSLVYVGIIGGPMVIAPLLIVLVIAVIGAAAHLRARRANADAAMLGVRRTNLVEETIALRETIKATAAGRQLSGRFDDLADETAYNAHVSRMASAAAIQVTSVLSQVATVACLAVGVFLVGAGDLTVGSLVACVMLVSRSVAPVAGLVAQMVRVAGLWEAARLAGELCAARQEAAGDDGRAPDGRVAGGIEFGTVTFTYPNEPAPALQDLSFRIEPGEKVGIVGRIGSGKSSLVRLIARLYTAEAGAILIDRHDIRQFAPDVLRRDVAYMPQDTDLFDLSIRENILLGCEGVSTADFESACAASGVADIASRHPSGYGFRVGPQGRRLSGGERQAVALARTLARRSPVVLLDEPTASMDGQFERLVVERLKTHLADRTVVIATHRAPILAMVDRIIWLDRGRIVADGPAADVIRRASGAAA